MQIAGLQTITPYLHTGTFGVGGELAAELVVAVDYRVAQLRPGKQLGLGFAVALHVAVVIEVIARQVGEHCDFKMRAVDPALIQPVRRHLDCHALRALGTVTGEFFLQRNRVGRSVGAAFQRAPEAIANGADHRCLAPQRAQRLCQPVADRSLAVGAGHADHRHVARRIAVHMRCNRTGQPAQPRHGQMWHLPRVVPAEIVLFPQYGGGTGGQRLSDEIAPVLIFAHAGEKYVARLYFAAVGNHALERHAELVQIVEIEDGTHHITSSLSSGCAGFGNTIFSTGASFGTPRMRSAPVITLANTGAATVPP